MGRRLVALLLILGIAWGGITAAVSTNFLPKLGLDLQGGISVILSAPEGTDPDVLGQAIEVMRNRIEASGVQEPEISPEGDRNVLVQLPGVSDTEEALSVIGQTGLLSFRPVLDVAPAADVALVGDQDDPGATSWLATEDGATAYLVGPSELLGTLLDEAVATVSQSGIGYDVNLVFGDQGADLFAALTAAARQQPSNSPQRQIAIVLDGTVISAPPVSEQVDPRIGIDGGRAVIGMGSDPAAEEDAEALAVVLRYGSLPIELERQSLQKVSATLGQDSLQAGVIAGLGGLAIVTLLLLGFYRSLGIVAVVGFTVFGSLLVLMFSLLGLAGLTLTLAGVTGIIVSVGITADSYIVYFERIKEEVRKGMSVEAAIDEGFTKAYRTIRTADFVSIMGAFLLWVLAVGPVKGFAMALGVATILDLIIAPWFTRNAVGLLGRGSLGDGGWFSIRGAAGRTT